MVVTIDAKVTINGKFMQQGPDCGPTLHRVLTQRTWSTARWQVVIDLPHPLNVPMRRLRMVNYRKRIVLAWVMKNGPHKKHRKNIDSNQDISRGSTVIAQNELERVRIENRVGSLFFWSFLVYIFPRLNQSWLLPYLISIMKRATACLLGASIQQRGGCLGYLKMPALFLILSKLKFEVLWKWQSEQDSIKVTEPVLTATSRVRDHLKHVSDQWKLLSRFTPIDRMDCSRRQWCGHLHYGKWGRQVNLHRKYLHQPLTPIFLMMSVPLLKTSSNSNCGIKIKSDKIRLALVNP